MLIRADIASNLTRLPDQKALANPPNPNLLTCRTTSTRNPHGASRLLPPIKGSARLSLSLAFSSLRLLSSRSSDPWLFDRLAGMRFLLLTRSSIFPFPASVEFDVFFFLFTLQSYPVGALFIYLFDAFSGRVVGI